MTKISTILLFILICFSVKIFSQVDSKAPFRVDKKSDSTHIQLIRRTSIADTLPPSIVQKNIAKIASKQDVDDIVEYGSRDSSELDNKNQIMYLWGDAYSDIRNVKSMHTLFG